MPKLLSIENFRGMVADAPDGKQPEGTCKTITNLVYDREVGSLVTRYTYENSLARPSGVATLNHWITKPVTYPSAQDMHVWFTEDGQFIRPYWHNSSTATDDWKLITENVDLSSITSSDVTVNASPTNTIVIANATTTWGLSSTTDYYKNWIFQGTGGNSNTYLVKSYTLATTTATFTLDNVLTINWVSSPDYKLVRYFHSDYSFTPAFTSPAGYSTERAIRWSGGQGSTVGYKNIKAGYVSRTFFAGTSSPTPHTFTGTYIDQAECKAPASSILSSSSFTVADANTNAIADGATGYDNKNFLQAGINWAGQGSHSVVRSGFDGGQMGDFFFGMTINSESDGDLVTPTSGNNVYLTTSYTNNVTSGVEYEVKIKGFAVGQFNQLATIQASATVSGTDYESAYLTFNPFYGSGAGSTRFGEQEVSFKFTPAATAKPQFRICLKNIGTGNSYKVMITGISCQPSASSGAAVEKNRTYKLFASYVYDSAQESELTYLGVYYVSGAFQKLSYELNQKLGALNKFVTAIRLYMSQEVGDTTTTTSTVVAPKYLMATIQIDDTATSTWTFDATAGRYEYAGSFNGLDWRNHGVTWEQKTGRVASTSTTCSYKNAAQASGRIFLANDYDYADAQQYTNRLRYTGFNGDGAPTPDIFANIQDKFITTVAAGQSQEIKNIVEYEGDVMILKKSSVLRLYSSNPNTLTWEILLIKNGIGTRSKYGALKYDRGLFFADIYSCYLYDGNSITDVLKGRWRNLYQSLVTSSTAESIIVWYNPINDSIALTTGNVQGLAQTYYEFNTDSWLPVKMDNGAASTYRIGSVVTTSDGVIHFAPQTVGANALKISQTAGSVLVDISIDTGYHDVPAGKTGRAKWVNVLAESGDASPFTVVLLGDGSTLQTGVFTPSATTKKLYKFQTTSDVPCKMFKVTLTQTGTVAPSTKEFKLHKIWVDGDIVDEQTDVVETVAVT